MVKGKCEEYCDGREIYTDGIFRYCQCQAVNMNTFVGANIKLCEGETVIERNKK